MSNKLLSIIVPTKNRYIYLKSLIRCFADLDNRCVELVIQDNSDDNSEFLAYLNENPKEGLRYNYRKENLSVVENSDLAVKNSTGKYVCFLGDDDLFADTICEFVKSMDAHGIEAAICKEAKYYWPDVVFKAHKFPNLVIPKHKKTLKRIHCRKELERVLRKGGVTLGHMPKLYQGIVARAKLDEVYHACGTYFPGPSPDIANAVALSLVVDKCVYYDAPIIVSGASPRSTAGLGTQHKHAGELKKVSFLPSDIEERWNEYVPKVWTAPTIYAQSLTEALLAMGEERYIDRFDYNYMYAYFSVFCSGYKRFLKPIKKKAVFRPIRYSLSAVSIFFMRVKNYLFNFFLTHFKIGGKLFDELPTGYDAKKTIDKYLGESNTEQRFCDLDA